MLQGAELRPTHDVMWTGRTLINRQGYPLTCIKNVTHFKIYVDKHPTPLNNTSQNRYYVVDLKRQQVLQYWGRQQTNIASSLVKFLTLTHVV